MQFISYLNIYIQTSQSLPSNHCVNDMANRHELFLSPSLASTLKVHIPLFKNIVGIWKSSNISLRSLLGM